MLLRRGTLEPAEVAAIGVRVLAVLQASHRAGYVHRDVKPEHVLLDRDANGELLVTLLDFGVCSAPTAPADERAREQGRVFGTPSYVSPEQASGKVDVDGRADLFSLGITMWECLAGRLPFRASNVSSLLLRIIREDAPPLILAAPDVPRELADLIHMALARPPEARFPSARAMSRALAPFSVDRAAVERRLASLARTTGSSESGFPTINAASVVAA
jgi:serine/threonine-protein kinase